MRNLFWLCAMLLFVACQSSADSATAEPEETTETPTELPFTSVELNDLSAFQATAANWSIAGQVMADYTKEHHIEPKPGTGVVVNQNDETNKGHLYTSWEHGDLDIYLEFMMPKGSNSGIYLQGRYEVQLLDSWLVDQPTSGDCGGIYQRWDEARPEGQKGYEGHAPRLNASKAPGLWQQMHIIFRAPRFDAAGNKTENARFEKVVHNGALLHENVEVYGPTRAAYFEDEAPAGPLVIQGDHGPVALRNIQYKRHFDEPKVALTDLTYQYYEAEGPITMIPDFDTMTVTKEGTTDSLVYQKLADRSERIAFQFHGKVQIPKAGDYLFTVFSDDGSRLSINGDMLLDNDGTHGYDPKSGLIHLEEGSHDFHLAYFNNDGGQGLGVFYEGPDMKRQVLLGRTSTSTQRERPQITVVPDDGPEMVRSFVMHEGEKLTHVMSVGDPRGLHYSVDLRRGGLVQFWRGEFADVTEMWYQRGQPQLLQPIGMEVEAHIGLLAAQLTDQQQAYPEQHGEKLKFKAYDINDTGQPVFQYQLGDALLSDRLQPDQEGRELVRTISTNSKIDQLYTRVAAAEYIEKVGSDYFTVGGNYYVRLLDSSAEPLIRQSNGLTELLLPLTSADQEVSYALLW